MLGLALIGSVSISKSELANNKADYYGGAILVVNVSVSLIGNSNVSISDSKLTNNRANRRGGAISVMFVFLFLSNSTLTNNRANKSGGAINVDLGSDRCSSLTVF